MQIMSTYLEYGANQSAIIVMSLFKSMAQSSCPALVSCFGKIRVAAIAKWRVYGVEMGKVWKHWKLYVREEVPDWNVEYVGGRKEEKYMFLFTLPEYKDKGTFNGNKRQQI